MDAVKLDCYSVEVAPPLSRLTGPEGFGLTRVSPEPLNPPVERFCSLLDEGKAEPEPRSWTRFSDAEFFNNAKHMSSVRIDRIAKQLSYSCEESILCNTKVENVKLCRRSGKVSRNSASYSKKSLIARAEDHAVFTDVDVLSSGSFQMKMNTHDKNPLARQKNGFNSKRGDRRSSKAIVKNKFDCVSLKTSLASCSSGSGGSSILGLYGLKTDIQDISKRVDDISLDDLLDGTYICPTFSKNDEVKVNKNLDILQSVKRACDVFQQVKLGKTEILADSDCCSSEKLVAPSACHSVPGNEDSYANSCFIDQDSTNSESPANLFDFTFAPPLDTLDRISLCPPKDLESLLLDAVKSIGHCRVSPESRLSKQLCRRSSLPPFSWSHGNHSKSNDVVKLQSRISYHGRWVRLGNYVCSPRLFSHYLNELDSLAFDESLVPKFPGIGPSVEMDMKVKEMISCCEKSSVVLAATPITSIVSQVENSPRLLRAARTLCNMSQDARIFKLSKALPAKTPKARKSKPYEKPQDEFLESTSLHVSKKTKRNTLDYKVCSKRAKLSAIDGKVLCHSKGRSSLSWYTPKSSRSSSSPNKSAKELVREVRSGAVRKQKGMLPPPPTKALAAECNGQRKVRKIMHMDWSRE